MKKPLIEISYWTYPEGDDFENIEFFKQALSIQYDAEIISQPTDAMGGGLYEFAIKIVSDITLTDFIKDFLEDGIKFGAGYFWKPIFQKIKELFELNKKFEPGIEEVRFIFRDVTIVLYDIYKGSIDEVIDEIIPNLVRHYNRLQLKIKHLRFIHIPIFNQVDAYDLCTFRVKLDVDENIESFNKSDYFNFWGIRNENGDNFVYDLKGRTVIPVKFYTQNEYDILLEKKFKS